MIRSKDPIPFPSRIPTFIWTLSDSLTFQNPRNHPGQTPYFLSGGHCGRMRGHMAHVCLPVAEQDRWLSGNRWTVTFSVKLSLFATTPLSLPSRGLFFGPCFYYNRFYHTIHLPHFVLFHLFICIYFSTLLWIPQRKGRDLSNLWLPPQTHCGVATQKLPDQWIHGWPELYHNPPLRPFLFPVYKMKIALMCLSR